MDEPGSLPEDIYAGVFCGSSRGASSVYREAAAALGRACADHGVAVVCGGASVGLMAVVIRATVEAGGRVIGVMPRFLTTIEPPEPSLSELILVDTMAERKDRMIALSSGFIILPGGLGTLDEAFEVMTLKQAGFHEKSTTFIDVNGFWRPMGLAIEHLVTEGFVVTEDRDTFGFCGDVASGLERFRSTARRRTQAG